MNPNNLRIALYALAFVLTFSLWNRWEQAQQPAIPYQPEQVIPYASASQQANGIPHVHTNPQQTTEQSALGANTAPIRISTDRFELWVNPQGGELIRADLRQYPVSLKNQHPHTLLQVENPGRFLVQSGLIAADSQSIAPSPNALYQSEKTHFEMGDSETLRVPLTWKNEQGLSITKTFVFTRGKHSFQIEQTINNQSALPWQGFPYERLVFGQARGSAGFGQVATFTGGVISSAEDSYRKVNLDDMAKKVQVPAADGWIAMIQHYFLGAIVPHGQEKRVYFSNANEQGDHFLGVSRETTTIAPNSQHTFQATVYLGPKIQKDLKALAPNLDKTVDYGVFFLISQPMFTILSWLNKLLGNWGWSIVIMTIIIKGLFFVPSAWAYKSMAKMRKLAPEMKRLQERFGEDRQAMSQEMMKLYKKEGVNPMSGCLPILLQIPFFLAFYWVLVESVELRQAPWMGWVQDLAVMDPYFILPIINAALMYFQQKLNPPPTDPMQAKIMQFLPLVFGVMFMWFPSGLVLYWTVSNAFSIAQQYVMNKRYGEKTSEKAA
ncbi:MAG: membrane protein insertase YidC [Cardiobacteriaceae bacterium]|nr:membrane protein insertase YidC [Cardiobacteriaceae bacterium]